MFENTAPGTQCSLIFCVGSCLLALCLIYFFLSWHYLDITMECESLFCTVFHSENGRTDYFHTFYITIMFWYTVRSVPFSRYCDPAEVAALSGNPGDGVTVPADCPEGYYCPLNTGVKTSVPCPAGTFSNTTQLQTVGECLMCTGGYFCDTDGQFTLA